MKKLLSISLLLLSAMLLKAQTQNAIWSLPPYYADFSSSPPIYDFLPKPINNPWGTFNDPTDAYDGYDKVYNMLGTEVLNENLTSTNNELKINNLKSGVYFYTVTQNNQTIKTDKLMVR